MKSLTGLRRFGIELCDAMLFECCTQQRILPQQQLVITFLNLIRKNKWLKVQYRDNDSPACAVKNTKKYIVETTGDNLQMKAVAKYFLSFDLNWFRKIIQYRL